MCEQNRQSNIIFDELSRDVAGTVIVIDDDEDLSEGIVEHLKRSGFEVYGTGKNGLEAVQLFEKYRPDIVLLDMNMPNYDGIYGIENIRKMDTEAKIVILTGFFSQDMAEKIKHFDISKIIEKPCSLGQIEQELKLLL